MIISTSADDTVRVWTTPSNVASDAPIGDTQSTEAAMQHKEEHWVCKEEMQLPLQVQHALACIALPQEPDW